MNQIDTSRSSQIITSGQVIGDTSSSEFLKVGCQSEDFTQLRIIEPITKILGHFAEKFDVPTANKPVILDESVTLIAEEESCWRLETDEFISMRPHFASLVAVHEAYHYYFQGSRSYDDARAVRANLGPQVLSLFDIAADREAFVIWKDTFKTTFYDYLEELRASNSFRESHINQDQLSRFSGSLLSILLKDRFDLFRTVLPIIQPDGHVELAVMDGKSLTFHRFAIEDVYIRNFLRCFRDPQAFESSEYASQTLAFLIPLARNIALMENQVRLEAFEQVATFGPALSSYSACSLVRQDLEDHRISFEDYLRGYYKERLIAPVALSSPLVEQSLGKHLSAYLKTTFNSDALVHTRITPDGTVYLAYVVEGIQKVHWHQLDHSLVSQGLNAISSPFALSESDYLHHATSLIAPVGEVLEESIRALSSAEIRAKSSQELRFYEATVRRQGVPTVSNEVRNENGIMLSHPLKSNFLTRYSHDPLHDLVGCIWSELGLDCGEDGSVVNEAVVGAVVVPWLKPDSPYRSVVDVSEEKDRDDIMFFYCYNRFRDEVLASLSGDDRREVENLFVFDITKAPRSREAFALHLANVVPDYSEALDLLVKIDNQAKLLSEVMMERHPEIFSLPIRLYGEDPLVDQLYGESETTRLQTLTEWGANPFGLELPDGVDFFELKMKIFQFIRLSNRHDNKLDGEFELRDIFDFINLPYPGSPADLDKMNRFRRHSGKFFIETAERESAVYDILAITYPDLEIPDCSTYSFVYSVDYSQMDFHQEVLEVRKELHNNLAILKTTWPMFFTNSHNEPLDQRRRTKLIN